MTAPHLREQLDDLVTEVSSYVEPDARAAWAVGARRRTRRRLAVTVCVLVLVGLVGTTVSLLPRSRGLEPASGDPGTAGYPARIDKPLWLRDLPSDGVGTVAGALERADGSWLAVSPAGRLWRIPGADGRHPVTVSPDGRRLAFLDARPGQELTVLELDNGSSSQFSVGADGVAGDGAGGDPWVQAPGIPSLWAPDSQRLLVPVRPAAGNVDRGVDALLWRIGGVADPVRLPTSLTGAVAAGWVSEHRLGWVTTRAAGTTSASVVDLVVTDERGTVRRTVRLKTPAGPDRLDPTSVSLSPDGNVLVLGSERGRDGVDIQRFFTDDGSLSATMPGVPDAAAHCPAAWGADDSLLVPAAQSRRDAVLISRPTVDEQLMRGRMSRTGEPVVLADPRLDVICSTWAASVLRGNRHESVSGTLFGERTGWVSWHWRELGLGVVGVLALLVVAAALVVRRRSRLRRVSG